MILIYINLFLVSYLLLISCIVVMQMQIRRARKQSLERAQKISEELFGEGGTMTGRWTSHPHPLAQTHEARIEEIERRRDSVLAECNPDLPTYDPR